MTTRSLSWSRRSVCVNYTNSNTPTTNINHVGVKSPPPPPHPPHHLLPPPWQRWRRVHPPKRRGGSHCRKSLFRAVGSIRAPEANLRRSLSMDRRVTHPPDRVSTTNPARIVKLTWQPDQQVSLIFFLFKSSDLNELNNIFDSGERREFQRNARRRHGGRQRRFKFVFPARHGGTAPFLQLPNQRQELRSTGQ